jgi:hypothetical protein
MKWPKTDPITAPSMASWRLLIRAMADAARQSGRYSHRGWVGLPEIVNTSAHIMSSVTRLQNSR